MFDFKDKVVLITGAAQGFGRVLAQAFAERGAKLALCDINDDGGEETLAQVKAKGADGFYSHADISQEADVEALVAATARAASPRAGSRSRTVWAALQPSGGSEAVAAGRLAGRVSHTATLRYLAGVTPAMRFRLGPRVFHILAAIDEDERRRWLRCLCEERDL